MMSSLREAGRKGGRYFHSLMSLQDAIMTGGSQIVSWLWNMYNFELRLIPVLLEKQQQNTVLENPQKSSIQISLCQKYFFLFLLRIPFFFRHFFTMFFCDNAVPKWPKTFWVIFKHCAVAAKKKFSLEAERNVETVVWKEEVFLPFYLWGLVGHVFFNDRKKEINGPTLSLSLSLVVDLYLLSMLVCLQQLAPWCSTQW